MDFPAKQVGWGPNFKWFEGNSETTEINRIGKPSADVHTAPSLHCLSPAALDMTAGPQGGLATPPHQPRPILLEWMFLSQTKPFYQYHSGSLSCKIPKPTHHSKISERWKNKNAQPFPGSICQRTWLASLEGYLNLCSLPWAFCPRFVFKAAVVKARLGAGGQKDHQAVLTCIVPFSSRSEVSKSHPVSQL